MEVKRKTERPLRVFISFGSAERKLCRHINDILQAWGHQPFFDEEHIQTGDNLREKLTQGLDNVDAAVFCLSKDSLQSRWCPEELRILRQFAGDDNIHLLILEETDMRELPSAFAFLASRKGQDLSKWRDAFQLDESTGAYWLCHELEKENQLFDALERGDGPEVTAQRTTIRRRLSVNPDTVKRDDLLQRGIVGREWLAQRVRDWLNTPDASPLCVLYGGPGVGKSAFTARCTDKGPKPAAALFCQYDRSYENEPKMLVKTLAYLLSENMRDYRVRLSSVLDREQRLEELDAAGQFARLIERPLRDIPDAGRETRYMLIDALDECKPERRNEFARIIADFSRRLPRWIRIMVTSREVEEVTGPLSGAYRLDLNGEQWENLRDIREYYQQRLEARFGREASWNRALNELVKRSGGVFLYAQIVSDGIAAGKLPLDDPEKFPEDLSASFYRWFSWFFPDVERYQNNYRLPVGMILASEGPLPVEELGRVCGWDENRTEDFLRFLKPFLKLGTNLFHKETVTFSHQYLSEWLGSRRAGSYSSSPKSAKRKMAERFKKLFRQDVGRLTEYEALHLLDLLQEFCSSADCNAAMMNEEFADGLLQLGYICAILGDLSLSLAYYKQDKKTQQYRVNRRGDWVDWSNLALSYYDIGTVYEENGQSDEAVKLYQTALDISEHRIHHADLSNDQKRELNQDSLDCYSAIAGVYTDMGESAEALKFSQTALEMARQLTRDNATARDWRALGLVYYELAELSESGENYPEALGYYQEALKAVEKVKRERVETLTRKHIALDKQWLDWRDKLVCRHKIADMLLETGEAGESLSGYQETREGFLRLSKAYPLPQSSRDVCVSDNNLAYLLEQNDPNAALKLYRHDAALSEELARRHDTPFNHADLAVAYWNLANLWRREHAAGRVLTDMNRDEARAFAEKGMELARTLYESMRREDEEETAMAAARAGVWDDDGETMWDDDGYTGQDNAYMEADSVSTARIMGSAGGVSGEAMENSPGKTVGSAGNNAGETVDGQDMEAEEEDKDWKDYRDLYRDFQELCRWISGPEV